MASQVMETTLYQKSKTGRIKWWKIMLNDDRIERRWGLVGSPAQQTTIDYIPPIRGKTNTENALAQYQRLVKAQYDQGYVETEQQASVSAAHQTMSYVIIPPNFRAPKPIKKVPSDKTIEAILSRGPLELQKKYDGVCTLVAIDEHANVTLWSRTGENATANLMPLRGMLEILSHAGRLKPCSILMAETCVGDAATMKDFDDAKRLFPKTSVKVATHSIAKLSIERRKLQLVIFDVLYWDGESIVEEIYEDRMSRLMDLDGIRMMTANTIMTPEKIEVSNIEQYRTELARLRERGWEGYVIRDLRAPTDVTFDGLETRPEGCWKYKLGNEDDFVAINYVRGKGKNRHKVGKFTIGQYDKDGALVDCGEVGTGLTDVIRHEALDWEYPCVVSVKYEKRQDANGATKLRFPVFLKKHEDKKPQDCIFAPSKARTATVARRKK